MSKLRVSKAWSIFDCLRLTEVELKGIGPNKAPGGPGSSIDAKRHESMPIGGADSVEGLLLRLSCKRTGNAFRQAAIQNPPLNKEGVLTE